ncbi:methyltransferase domain-containing protein [Pedobacter nutrimenti]|uniref:Methyltransferase family protein n=1 Tax=Pedobacter nutrimenti TaxID=1241337 RepID=A0A318UC98_9SPHI|nr:methyltransferase domain-containing protein [Pedobacter nutrimenti]PYF72872.1 methyltransferase family protein [Pedobacter nutrimenti]
MKILKQDTPLDRIKKNAKKKFKALKIDILKKDISYLCPPNILNEFTAEIRSMDAFSKYNSHYDFLKNFEDAILKNVKSKYVQINGNKYQLHRSNSGINFRESCIDLNSHLSSRMRFCLEVINTYFSKSKNVYLSEHQTTFHKRLSELNNYNITSSWFNSESIYFQDLTQLSYPDNHFDLSLTFEDLEHIPNYKLALAELFRVTKHGGAVLLSAPFATNSQQNIIRAKLSDKGEIVHLMKPEYHGDPLKEAEGILCFQHFGWDFLDELRDAGFSDVFAVIGYNINKMMLGRQLFIIGKKQ